MTEASLHELARWAGAAFFTTSFIICTMISIAAPLVGWVILRDWLNRRGGY